MENKKVIAHIDVDSFFVSAELLLRPELKNKEIAIAKNFSNSICSALSYEAKNKGAKVPMKIYEVKKICPNIIVLEPNYYLYETISKKIYCFLKENYTLNIEVGSIDEWYLDLSLKAKQFSSLNQLAKKIQKDILDNIGLDISIGISYNKFNAKIASELNKPKGICIIDQSNFKKIVWPLDIDKFIGIGKKTSTKLKENNILTIGDLANINEKQNLHDIFKNQLNKYIEIANGKSSNKVDSFNDEPLSISAQYTFMRNKSDIDLLSIQNIFRSLSKRIYFDLKEKYLVGKSLSITIKNLKHEQFVISKNYKKDIFDIDDIYNKSIQLFNQLWDETFISTLSIRISNLKSVFKIDKSISFFDKYEPNKKEIIYSIINETNKKLKSNSLKTLNILKKE